MKLKQFWREKQVIAAAAAAAAAADTDVAAETNWKHKVTPDLGDLITLDFNISSLIEKSLFLYPTSYSKRFSFSKAVYMIFL